MLLTLIIAGATLFAGVVLHRRARDFVRKRLRYVDAAHGRLVPWFAGGATTLVAGVLASLLPIVGLGSAIVLGIAVGTGVAAGSKDVRLAPYRLE